MKIQSIVKGLLTLTLTATLCISATTSVFAQKKKKEKAKKEKITDPRLLAVMKMTKMTNENQFVVKNQSLKTAHRAVQGFDISEDGTMWYGQPGQIGKQQQGLTKIHENYIIRVKDGKREVMTLNYFGGANSICVEHAADGDYVWVSSNGDKWKGHYHRTRTISRVPFVANSVVDNGCAGETFYLGGDRYCWPAIDIENKVFGVATQNAGTVTIRTYNLDDVYALDNSPIKIKTTWKGENVGEAEEKVSRTFQARDLSQLEPLTTFTLPKLKEEECDPAKDPNCYSFRAWDIDKDYVYFVEGKHNGDKAKTESKAYITVFDHSGRVVLPKRRIQAIHDYYLLGTLDIAPKGYADVAGIRVKSDGIYILFAGKGVNSKGKSTLRANVVKY